MNARRLRHGLVVALLGLSSQAAQAAWPPTLETETLTSAERSAATKLIEHTGTFLPTSVMPQIPPLQLSFDDDLPAVVHGRIRASRIRLARHLLDAQNPEPAAAALLHELAHALDRRLNLSRNPRFLDLAGWQIKPRRMGLRDTHNRLRDRSPDVYELTSPREFFAVNFEHFLRDPAYACRRPALHRFLVEHIGTPRHAESPQCAPGLPFVVPDAGSSLETLDPARVHSIEYLLAEPTDAAMSRWGHSMLRLVICAPGRDPGPDCRFDLQHHRVLSFRAFVDDVQISSWRGLTGRYPSRLYVLPLDQVIEEYTAIELRGLRSVPLNLSDAEKAGLLERAAQLHWNYDGRYTFLGNNCASETYKLLRDGVPRLAHERIAAVAPTALLRRLERAGIAEPTPLAREDAVRLGYHFPAADRHYAELFDIARTALDLPARDVHAWLEFPPQRRAVWMQVGDLRASAALLVLEEAALRRAELRARDILKRQLLRNRKDPKHILIHDTLALEGALARPASLLENVPGYGLPQFDERRHASERFEHMFTRWQQHSGQLHEWAQASLPAATQQMLAITRRNLEHLGQHLRTLSD